MLKWLNFEKVKAAQFRYAVISHKPMFGIEIQMSSCDKRSVQEQEDDQEHQKKEYSLNEGFNKSLWWYKFKLALLQ